jgi:hypothetical protein
MLSDAAERLALVAKAGLCATNPTSQDKTILTV